MPLSDHEQQLLDQIERALYAEDPKFATTVRSSDLRTHMRRRLRRAGMVLVLGFVFLVYGVVAQKAIVGVAGFVVMLGSLLLALASWRRLGSHPAPTLHVAGSEGAATSRRKAKSPRARGSWSQRLEDRWKRRFDDRDR